MVRPSFRSALSLLLSLPLFSSAAPTCTDLLLSVTAHSQVREIILPPNLIGDPNAINDLINSVGGIAVTLYPLVPAGGTYDISAKYCEPEIADSRSETIQVLVHGATYTKTYWSGLGLPEDEAEQYSWIDYASKKGYPTLSIDLLGTGGSSHPDPNFEVQDNLEAEVIHEIILKLRNGEIQNKSFSEIIYVGHSLGSGIGVVLSQNHPADIDALILTGWSTTFIENTPTVLGMMYTPAALVDPKRFGDLGLTYLTRGSKPGARHGFYGLDGSFDPEVETHDFETASTMTVAELVTVFRGFEASNGYGGAVKVINGEEDKCFCEGGHCSDGPNGACALAANMFPSASTYSYSIIPRTGHCLNVHYTAEQSFQAAHDFLEENGF